MCFSLLQSKINNRHSSIVNQISQVADESPEFGRSPAFRRKILSIFDHQCAACGLRIKLPAGNDVSFIDAAHLIPFSESQNDHPTNGLALCKNHHWAMDRNLIAPAPDHHWPFPKFLILDAPTGKRNIHSTTAQLHGRAANQALVIRNWLVGEWIIEFQQHGKDRAKYGTITIDDPWKRALFENECLMTKN